MRKAPSNPDFKTKSFKQGMLILQPELSPPRKCFMHCGVVTLSSNVELGPTGRKGSIVTEIMNPRALANDAKWNLLEEVSDSNYKVMAELRQNSMTGSDKNLRRGSKVKKALKEKSGDSLAAANNPAATASNSSLTKPNSSHAQVRDISETLNSHLQQRPGREVLESRNILQASEGKRALLSESLEKKLNLRPTAADLAQKNILPGISPAKKAQLEMDLKRSLDRRPSLEDLQDRKVLHSSNHEVFVFGINEDGQLGHGNKKFTLPCMPLLFFDRPSVKCVSVGNRHTALVLTDGLIYCWGNNDYGQLGDASTASRIIPALAHLPSDENAIGICCGRDFTVALGESGHVFTSGSNHMGCLGTGERTENTVVFLNVASLQSVTVDEVWSGIHTVFAAFDGRRKLVSWGSAERGELGLGSGREEYLLWKPEVEHPIIDLTATDGKPNISKVSHSVGHVLALMSNGTLWGWGRNDFNQLCPKVQPMLPAPVLLSELDDLLLMDVAAGGSHTILLAKSSSKYGSNYVLTFGDGSEGRLGHNRTKGEILPKDVQYLENEGVVGIAAGEDTSFAWTASNKCFAWGSGVLNQLGHITETRKLTPKPIEPLNHKRIVFMAVQVSHAIVVTDVS